MVRSEMYVISLVGISTVASEKHRCGRKLQSGAPKKPFQKKLTRKGVQ